MSTVMMRRMGLSMLLALTLVRSAAAHRLDEYLQATLIGVTREGVDVEMHLTPGVAMLPVWMALIDEDRDGRISPEEERAYARRVAGEVELRVDGTPVALSLIESNFPTLEAMQDGLGTIVIKLRTARSGRKVRFENRHLPQVSAYLVNCLAAALEKNMASDSLVMGPQNRDEAQRSIEFEYSFGAGGLAEPQAAWVALGRFWPAGIGLLLVARMAMLIHRSKHDRAKHDKRASQIVTS